MKSRDNQANIEILKQKLAALDVNAQRHLTAFLISLQDARPTVCRRTLAEKIDQPASQFATLEDLDRRLGFSEKRTMKSLSKIGGERSVPTDMPTPVGQTIHCTARVISVEGSKMQFQIEARDAQEVIVRGLHKHAIIRTESFTKRVRENWHNHSLMRIGTFYLRFLALFRLLLISLAASGCVLSLTAAQPSDVLVRIIPDVQQRLESGDWTNRAVVLNLLVRSLPGSEKPGFEMRYDLPRDDYAYVLDAIIDGLGQSPDGKPWRNLEESMPAWVYVIKKFQLEETTDRIARLLENTNGAVKGFSLGMLWTLEASKYDAAIARLLRPETPQFHRAARDLLIKFHSKEVVPTLIEELGNEHYLPRYYALEALEKIADPLAIPALAQSILDPYELNRTAALRALLQIFKKQNMETNVIPYARTVFHNSTQDGVVCRALALMVDYGALDSIQPVMDRLAGTNELARGLMDDALREVSPRIMASAYISALESNAIYAGDSVKSDYVREYFILQLGRMKSQQAVPLLMELSAKKHWYLRHFAVQALGEIGSPDALPLLTGFLKEQTNNIHEETIIALLKIADRRALPTLKEYLFTPGLDLANLAFSFNGPFFPDVARKINIQRVEFAMRGTPGDVLARLSRETGIPIRVKVPESNRSTANTLALPIMEIQKGQPVEGWVANATTRLGEAYNARFTYVIGDGEIFVVPNAQLPETFLTIFDKMLKSR